MKRTLFVLTALLATASADNLNATKRPILTPALQEISVSQLNFEKIKERIQEKLGAAPPKTMEDAPNIPPKNIDEAPAVPSSDTAPEDKHSEAPIKLLSEPEESHDSTSEESTTQPEKAPIKLSPTDESMIQKIKKSADEAVLADKKLHKDMPKDPLPIDDLRLFVEILEQLKGNYVDPVTDSKLIKNAIKGMVAELDPHSDYYDEEEFEKLQEQTTGSFAGLGIEVLYDDKLKALRVVKPLFEGPAYNAGILADDRIIQIDKTPVSELTMDRAVGMLRGEIDTEVELVILREEKELNFTVTRGKIETDSVTKAELYNDETAYIRLEQFQESTAKEIRKAFSKLQKEAEEKANKITGLILDLRNNPGGLLLQAVEVTDLFLDSGLIVYTKGQSELSKEEFNAKEGDLLKGAPIVVLINSSSASASEIVAGALQDHRRALIVGEQSFGKGSVQTIVELENGQGLKYTSARYYTPNGASIQTRGIVPDVVVAPLKVTLKKGASSLREADIKGHLVHTDDAANATDKLEERNGNDLSENQKVDALKKEAQKLVDNSAFAEEDYPLYEALNILRALNIHQDREQ